MKSPSLRANCGADAQVGRVGTLLSCTSLTSKKIFKTDGGNVLLVISDDPETMHDMPMLIERLGHNLVDVQQSAGEIQFIIEVCK